LDVEVLHGVVIGVAVAYVFIGNNDLFIIYCITINLIGSIIIAIATITVVRAFVLLSVVVLVCIVIALIVLEIVIDIVARVVIIVIIFFSAAAISLADTTRARVEPGTARFGISTRLLVAL